MKKIIRTVLARRAAAARLAAAGWGLAAGNASVSGNVSKIGIIAALDSEVNTLISHLENKQSCEIAGNEYHFGRIGNYDVVCMQCGVGKVSAALGTQVMIMQFDPDVVINTGTAGALAQELEVGDIVLADCTVEWDLDTIVFGNPRGYVYAMDKVTMTNDKTLTDEVASVIGKTSRVHRGLVASGDQFVSTPEQRSLILGAFPDALCVEMEGSAIGHVCEQNGVPFCVIRCISDNANGDSGVLYTEFSQETGERSAGYLLKFLNGN